MDGNNITFVYSLKRTVLILATSKQDQVGFSGYEKGSFMNRKMVYLLSLVALFLLWGVFGFLAAPAASGLALQGTIPAAERTLSLPEGTPAAGIPITSEPEPVWTEIVVFYGLIGLTAMFLMLALLSFANKSTTPYAEQQRQPSNETHEP